MDDLADLPAANQWADSGFTHSTVIYEHPLDEIPAELPSECPDPDISAPETDVEVVDDGVEGKPEQWSSNWFFQQLDGYCGPASASQIVSEYTGLDISDPQQLMDRAMELGLMHNDDPSQGMTLPNLEILLDDQGVPSHIENSSMDDLEAKLDAGYGVIAMVDSGEIWNPEKEQSEDDQPDHFLVVAGIDQERGVVILSDPGSPDGNQLEVPIEQFEDAWADSDHEMLVADEIDPDLAPTPDSESADSADMALEQRPWAMLPL